MIFKKKNKAPKLITNESKSFKGFKRHASDETMVGYDKIRSMCYNKIDMEINFRTSFVRRSVREEIKDKFLKK